MRFRIRIAPSVALAIGVLLPLAISAVAIVATDTKPLVTDVPAEAQLVPVTHATIDGRSVVQLAAAYDESIALAAPTTGTVTDILAEAGSTINAGDVPIRINDSSVVAYVASAPLWRDIDFTVQGPDVLRAQELLASLGLSIDPIEGRWNASTRQAIRDFNEYFLGLESSTLHLADLLWLGSGPFNVLAVSSLVGDSVDPSTPMFIAPPSPKSISVGENQLGATAPDGEYVLKIETLEVPYRIGSRSVDSESMAAVAEAMGYSEDMTAEVFLRFPTKVMSVPSEAVVVGADGLTCVYTSPSAEPTLVQLVGGTTLSTQISSSEQIEQVLANPVAVLKVVTCGS